MNLSCTIQGLILAGPILYIPVVALVGNISSCANEYTGRHPNPIFLVSIRITVLDPDTPKDLSILPFLYFCKGKRTLISKNFHLLFSQVFLEYDHRQCSKKTIIRVKKWRFGGFSPSLWPNERWPLRNVKNYEKSSCPQTFKKSPFVKLVMVRTTL